MRRRRTRRRRTYLLHVEHPLLQLLDLSVWTVCVCLRVVVVRATSFALLLPQKIHLAPVGVELPTQGVVLLPQRRLFTHSCRRRHVSRI